VTINGPDVWFVRLEILIMYVLDSKHFVIIEVHLVDSLEVDLFSLIEEVKSVMIDIWG
jgi:hypothetical protein